MDFKSSKKSIGGLFSCKKQFIIPRFQREYSWGKIELNEFLDDILSRITLKEDGSLDTSEYFWGSLLLIGDLDDQKELGVEVVDGQQRITTMTIFLSVITKMFLKNKEKGLSDALWEYIIGKDANTEEFAVLKNETPKPFFQFIIQQLEEEKMEPKNAEEEKILTANKFFKQHLSKTGLNKKLDRLNKKELIGIDYIDLLKIIRDQLLRSYVICISTTDSEYANMIFEILNAKGKELASVDLIKNAIFEKLNNQVPADKAKELWLKIRDNLCSRRQRIEFATFYRHFWISCYGKVQDNKLYSDFLKKIPRNDDEYLKFLKQMETISKIYVKILKPSLESDFENKKEYNFAINELFAINNIFGIVQVRPILLSLFYNIEYKEIMTYRQFKKLLVGLSSFHYMYNAICSKRTSSLETPLNTAANGLFNATTKETFNEIVTNLKNALVELIPTKEEFCESFIQLQFSKANNPSNMITKYTLNKWQSIISGNDIYLPDSSIEHIIDEDENNEKSLNIGNLLLIEQQINSSIPHGLNLEKKLPFYNRSKYESVNEFLENYNQKSWNNEDIEIRCNEWAEKYYNKLNDLVKSII